MTWFPIHFLMYYSYFKVRKPTFLYNRPNLVSKFLACLKSSKFFPDFYHSFYTLFVSSGSWNYSEEPICCLPQSIFCVGVSDLCGCLFCRSCTWKKNSQHSIGFPMLAIKGAPADHDTHICCPVPILSYVSICHCIMGSILWLCQIRRLFKVCAPVKDVTKYSLNKITLKRIPEKNYPHKYSKFWCLKILYWTFFFTLSYYWCFVLKT